MPRRRLETLLGVEKRQEGVPVVTIAMLKAEWGLTLETLIDSQGPRSLSRRRVRGRREGEAGGRGE